MIQQLVASCKNQALLIKWKVQDQKHTEWLKRRIDTDLEVGCKVDIRDKDYVWVVGTVKLVIESIKREPVLVVHYDGLDNLTDEVIFRNSVRLAKSGTYTCRNDIPKHKKSDQPSPIVINQV